MPQAGRQFNPNLDEKYPDPRKRMVSYFPENDEKAVKPPVDLISYDEEDDIADSKYGPAPIVKAPVVYQDTKDFFSKADSNHIFQALVRAAEQKQAERSVADKTKAVIQNYLRDLQTIDFHTKFTTPVADDKRSAQEIADEQLAMQLQLEELGAFKPRSP